MSSDVELIGGALRGGAGAFLETISRHESSITSRTVQST